MNSFWVFCVSRFVKMKYQSENKNLKQAITLNDTLIPPIRNVGCQPTDI